MMSEYRTGGFYDFLGEVLLAAGKGAINKIEAGGSAKDVAKEAGKGTVEKGATALRDALSDAPAAVKAKVEEAVKGVEANAKKKATSDMMIWVVVGILILMKGR
jgi:hypothetical protein